MKVMIADDEQPVREGLELLIDWDRYGVTELIMADNGADAVDLLQQHKPAVIFCDMRMPMMNGMELMEWLNQQDYSTQIVVISGFNDFEYMQAAIRAGGVDYILKPIRKSEAEHALERAIAIWKEHEEHRLRQPQEQHMIREADFIKAERKLASYFRSEIPYHPQLPALLDHLGLSVDGPIHLCMMLPQNRSSIIDLRFGGDSELFHFALNNIAHDLFQAYGSCCVCRLDDRQILLLVVFKPNSPWAKDYEALVRRTIEAWRKILQLEVVWGRSHSQQRLDSIHKMMMEAKEALYQVNLLTKAASQPPEEPLPSLLAQQYNLQQAVESGSKSYAAQIVQAYVEQITARGGISLKELQVCTMEVNLMLNRLQDRLFGASGRFAFITDGICHVQEWEQAVVHALWSIIEERNPSQRNASYLEDIKQYLDEHYQEDLSLADLADHFHLSPHYICRKFKEKFQTTVVAYMTEKRMEQAKSLLMHTNASITEIAYLLGYWDENYFSKVFKKHTGEAPRKFRTQYQVVN